MTKITVPAGASIRTTDRNTKQPVKVRVPESFSVPVEKVTASLSPNSLRTVLAFQYKGRRATILKRRVIQGY